MAGKNNIKFRMPKSLLPSAKKIAKRGLYEIMWGSKPCNYEKRIKEGKYQKGEVSQSSIVTAENINVNGYQFENEQAYVAMELTKAWIAAKNEKFDNYINEDDVANAFNKIYRTIGKVGEDEGYVRYTKTN